MVDEPKQEMSKDGGGGNVPDVVDVEKQAPASAVAASSSSARSSKTTKGEDSGWWKYLLGGFLIGTLVVLIIVLPIFLPRGSGDGSAGTATTKSSSLDSGTAVVGDAVEGSSSAAGATSDVSETAAGQEEPAFKKTMFAPAGPFNATLNLFNEDITKKYTSIEELRNDVEQAAWFFLNQVVKRNTGDGDGYYSGGGPFPQPMPMPVMSDVASEEADMAMPAAPMPEASKGFSGGVPDTLSDFGTNNQEDFVEEGDIVVSDGDYVYAAYNDYIVIFNAKDGQLAAQVKMPSADEMMKAKNFTLSSSSSTGSEIAPGGYYPYYSSPRIQNMVLYENRLLVIVDGYEQVFRQMDRIFDPVIYNYGTTHVRLYDTKELINSRNASNVIGTANVHGQFGEVRAVDGKAHVMTISSVHSDSYLSQPFSRSNFPWYTTDEEYIAHVYKTAKEQAIPFFVDKLVKELTDDGKTIPNLARISLWQSELSGTELESMTYSDGVLNSIAQIHSLDMMGNAKELGVKSAGAFLPSSSWGANFYGAPEAVIIAGQGWDYVSSSMSSVQSTYFLAFKLDGASSDPHAVGKVDGYVLNNHGIDIVDNVLRVATSIQSSWRITPVVQEDSTGEAEAADGEGGEVKIEEEPSSTQNYVLTLQLPDMNDGSGSAIMEELGRLKLGKPDELFTAVRFFDNIAYAVTFERRDPFYVLDLENPREPAVLAELDISGFSSYLHSMNDDNTLMLAIGEEADNDGNILGVQVTVFDVRDPSNPVPNVRHTIEQSTDVYSSSRSLDDFKATRYAGERLIIPMDIWSYGDNNQQSFHGFVTYFVNATTIQPECRIRHGQEEIAVVEDSYGVEEPSDVVSEPECFYCGASLPPRSMIFEGNLMTMKDHFVRSNNMNTCDLVWSLDIKIKNENGGCCGAWGWGW